MKSFNHLSISGVVIDLRLNPERDVILFTLSHNFGGGVQPLFLQCIAPKKIIDECRPENGDSVRVEACLKPHQNKITLNVKSITNPNRKNYDSI